MTGTGSRRWTRRRIIGRLVLLVAFGVSLYLVTPGLLALFGSHPASSVTCSPRGSSPSAVLQTLAFVSIWELTRVALKTRRWFDVVVLATRRERVEPGAARAVRRPAGRSSSRCSRAAGFEPATTTTALTAVGLLSTATLFVLPVLAIVPMLFGLAVDSRLIRGAILGAVDRRVPDRRAVRCSSPPTV